MNSDSENNIDGFLKANNIMKSVLSNSDIENDDFEKSSEKEAIEK